MKATTTPAELKALLKQMQHRERFVFNCAKHTTVEIYCTVLYDKTSGSDKNIKISVISEDGETKHQNKLLRLFTENNFNQLNTLIQP
jgi:hypothetical protein